MGFDLTVLAIGPHPEIARPLLFALGLDGPHDLIWDLERRAVIQKPLIGFDLCVLTVGSHPKICLPLLLAMSTDGQHDLIRDL